MVLRAATKDENAPGPRRLIMVAARDRGRACRSAHAQSAAAIARENPSRRILKFDLAKLQFDNASDVRRLLAQPTQFAKGLQPRLIIVSGSPQLFRLCL